MWPYQAAFLSHDVLQKEKCENLDFYWNKTNVPEILILKMCFRQTGFR